MTEKPIQDACDEVTDLLRAVGNGAPGAFDRLLPRVYGELRQIARRQMRDQQGHTLVATALVHEAYLKLGQARLDWQGRAHFFAVAARAMRQIVVDHARKKGAEKRGGGYIRTTLGDPAFEDGLSAEEVLALDEALGRLAELNERLSRVVEMRFFGGMTEQEAAAALGVPKRTLQRDWARARAWLYKELYPEGS